MKLKIKSKEELTAIAKDIFGRYRSAENVAVTSDGTAFITDENDLAVKNHSVKNRYGKKLAITEFTRDDVATSEKSEKSKAGKNAKEKTDDKSGKGSEGKSGKDSQKKSGEGAKDQKTAEDLIADIDAATDVDVVIAIAEAEKSGEKRKTVLDAAEAKLESLKTAE
ncbi:hypothetical protein [Labilibaculum sp.]|uniref:hypothetical protein n=1 Tax=Labilibaculum sp. TaxID=2060723 RepID=UPI002AA82E85|nr:hypothetical protein [Labilibaculum sp.]